MLDRARLVSEWADKQFAYAALIGFTGQVSRRQQSAARMNLKKT